MSLDSKQRAVVVGKTLSGGDVALVDGRLMIRDERGRLIVALSAHTTDLLKDALDGDAEVVVPVRVEHLRHLVALAALTEDRAPEESEALGRALLMLDDVDARLAAERDSGDGS